MKAIVEIEGKKMTLTLNGWGGGTKAMRQTLEQLYSWGSLPHYLGDPFEPLDNDPKINVLEKDLQGWDDDAPDDAIY